MAKYSIEDTTLVSLGNEIRAKVGQTRVERVYCETLTYNEVLYSGKKDCVIYIQPKDYITGEQIGYHHVKIILDIQATTSLNNFTYSYRDGYGSYDLEVEIDETDDIKGKIEAMLYPYQGSITPYVAVYITYTGSSVPTVKGTLYYEPFYETNARVPMMLEIPNTMTPIEMATAIRKMPDVITADDLKITGECEYMFYKDNWSWIIEEYGDLITTQNLTNTKNMFANCLGFTKIPFELNYDTPTTTGYTQHDLTSMFQLCQYLKEVPKLNNCIPKNMSNMLSSCKDLESIPEDFESWFNWEEMDRGTYSGMDGIFQMSASLRSVPMDIFNHGKNINGAYYLPTYNAFNSCLCFDEVNGFPLASEKEWTSNIFYNTVNSTSRLKNFTFAMLEDNIPYSRSWKSQTLDFSKNVGYFVSYESPRNTTVFNSANKVTDAETYAALKDNPDYWTHLEAYSRYNHDSAVATINSLPDTSSYLAASGGTNTIKFKGNSGSATDGGAINTLTEEEIAVATARGWTVSLV